MVESRSSVVVNCVDIGASTFHHLNVAFIGYRDQRSPLVIVRFFNFRTMIQS